VREESHGGQAGDDGNRRLLDLSARGAFQPGDFVDGLANGPGAVQRPAPER